mmetsp:Transcript_8110/g.25009  ORF Transcript_8110/g.25009 Transcript_8110/m.25009 type:complete len:216 (-) Transcript_8110:947-1594(-)
MENRGAGVKELGLQALGCRQLGALAVPEALEVLLVDSSMAELDDLPVEAVARLADDDAAGKAALALPGSPKELPMRGVLHHHPSLGDRAVGPGQLGGHRRRVRAALPPLLQRLLVHLALAHGVHGAEEGGAGLRPAHALLAEAHVRVLHELYPLTLLPQDAHNVTLEHDADWHVARGGPSAHDDLFVLHYPRLPVARDQSHCDASLRWRILPHED